LLGVSREAWRCAGTVAFVAGAAAAVGSSVVKVPLAVCVRSVQAGVYSGPLAAARAIVETAGVRSLFTVRPLPLCSVPGES
jgi:solute carrier family 25 S-adenosylmethionine transporter 26